MVKIPWEDQISYYSSSVKGSLGGKELEKYKQKWWDVWTTGMHSFTMCCLCFSSSLCLMQYFAFCHVQHSTDKCFCKGTGPQKKWCCHVYLCEHAPSCSTLQQRIRAFQDLPTKRFIFSFHNGPFFSWDVAHCQANVSLILQKGYSKVLYLIQYSCSLYRFCLTVMRVSLSTLLN